MGHMSLLSKLIPPDRRLSAAAGRCRNCCASTPPTGRPPTSRPPWSTSCAATAPSAWRSSPPPPSRPLPSGRPSSSGDSRRCRHEATIADAGGENRRRRRPRPAIAHAALAAPPTAPRRRGPGWRDSRLTRQYVPRQPRRAVAPSAVSLRADPAADLCGPRRPPPSVWTLRPGREGPRTQPRRPTARAGGACRAPRGGRRRRGATVPSPTPPIALRRPLRRPPSHAPVQIRVPTPPSGPGLPGPDGRRPAMMERAVDTERRGSRSGKASLRDGRG